MLARQNEPGIPGLCPPSVHVCCNQTAGMATVFGETSNYCSPGPTISSVLWMSMSTLRAQLCMLINRCTRKQAAAHLKILDEYISISDQTRFLSEKEDIFTRKQKDGSSTWNIVFNLEWTWLLWLERQVLYHLVVVFIVCKWAVFSLLGGRWIGLGLVSFLYHCQFYVVQVMRTRSYICIFAKLIFLVCIIHVNKAHER